MSLRRLFNPKRAAESSVRQILESIENRKHKKREIVGSRQKKADRRQYVN